VSCPKLTTVNLPSLLEKIGFCAFSGCRELNNLTIPAKLTTVRWLAHYDYDGTKEEDTDNSAFVTCQKLPIKTRQAIQALGYTGNF